MSDAERALKILRRFVTTDGYMNWADAGWITIDKRLEGFDPDDIALLDALAASVRPT